MQQIPSIEELCQSIDDIIHPAFTQAIHDMLISFQHNHYPVEADEILRILRDEALEMIKCTLNSAKRYRDEVVELRMELEEMNRYIAESIAVLDPGAAR